MTEPGFHPKNYDTRPCSCQHDWGSHHGSVVSPQCRWCPCMDYKPVRASVSAVSTPQEALDLEEVRRTLEENWVLTPPQAEVLIAEVERLRAALASQPEQEKPWPKA